MKKAGLLGIVLVLALGLLVPMMAQVTTVYGCEPPPPPPPLDLSPGFWKNHTDAWAPVPLDISLYDATGIQLDITLMEALRLRGSSTAISVHPSVIRYAAAEYLNTHADGP